MGWSANVAVLSVLLSFEGVRLQTLSVEDANVAIEFINNCKCVKHYQCDDNNNIIMDGRTVLNIRFSITAVPVKRINCQGGIGPNEIVCCKLNGSSTTLTPVSENPDNDDPAIMNPGRSKCGIQKTAEWTIGVRSVDLNSLDGEFPWNAAIFKKTSSGGYTFLCSGSLIHPRVILTINHCVHKKKTSNLRVVVNGKTKLSESDATEEEKRDVSEIVNHPKYDDRLLLNDAALLFVESPFVIRTSGHINTLCLPPSGINLEGKRCLVAGWKEETSGLRLKRLKKVEVPFVNHARCQSLLRGTRLSSDFSLHNSFICAGGERGQDACLGDGGSALVCPMNLGSDQYFQAGIVSWGVGCGNENVPGVYTNVADTSEWIKNELHKRQLHI